MPILMYLVDQYGVDKKFFTAIQGDDFDLLIASANKKNLRSLSLLDIAGNTIFNKKQAKDILDTVGVLEENPSINKYMLDFIKLGAKEVLAGNNLYLKFEGE